MTLANFSNVGGLYTVLMEREHVWWSRDMTVSQDAAIFVGGDQFNNMKWVGKFSENGI